MNTDASYVSPSPSTLTTKSYIIKHPSTTYDDGLPSDDLLHDCHRILDMIEDERHIMAQELHSSVKERIIKNAPKPSSPAKHGLLRRRKQKQTADKEEEKFKSIVEFLAIQKDKLEDLEEKAEVFKRAQKTLKESDDWTFSQTMFGVSSYYRSEADGSLSIKMEGTLKDVPIFEQIAILREIDLYQTWSPFCSSSIVLKELEKLDSVGWFVVGVPQLGLARDGIFRAIGCDNLSDDGSVIICAQGLQDRPETEPFAEPYLTKNLDSLDCPDKPTGMGSGRMTIRNFSALVTFHSATCFETKLVANVNPNLPLPQSLLDFFMKKVCGVMLSKLQGAAKKAAKDPVRNPHAQRMREDEFYQSWLLPKFQNYCKTMNWKMPEVKALHLTDDQLEKEFALQEAKRTNIFGSIGDGDSRDDGSTSSMSRLTVGTMNTGFPSITRYLREMEEKVELKKARKIAVARLRAASRLKPKELSEEQKTRLKELKEAKARRSHNNGVLGGAKPKVEQIESSSSLHGHGRGKRFLITTAMCCVLAITLYPDFLLCDLDKTTMAYEQSWFINIFLDTGSLFYLCVCSIVHFAVCHVSMLYTFYALDLGMKTGRKSKNYYDESVRMAVATMSGSIVAFSVGKGIIKVFIRVLTWNSIRALGLVNNLLSITYAFMEAQLPSIITANVSLGASFTFGFISWTIHYIIQILCFVFQLIRLALLRSNKIGMSLEWIVSGMIRAIPPLQSNWNNYVENVLAVYQDSQTIPAWRYDAIKTARLLFSYTAVFLITILILFNFTSRVNKLAAELHLKKYLSIATSMEQNTSGKTDFPIEQVSTNNERSEGYSVSVNMVPNIMELNKNNSNFFSKKKIKTT